MSITSTTGPAPFACENHSPHFAEHFDEQLPGRVGDVLGRAREDLVVQHLHDELRQSWSPVATSAAMEPRGSAAGDVRRRDEALKLEVGCC